jgi:hypothetical protein
MAVPVFMQGQCLTLQYLLTKIPYGPCEEHYKAVIGMGFMTLAVGEVGKRKKWNGKGTQ